MAPSFQGEPNWRDREPEQGLSPPRCTRTRRGNLSPRRSWETSHSSRQQFAECKLRVFSLANKKDELDRETRNMAALLAKFRIDFSSVLVIPDVTKRASDDMKNKLAAKLAELPAGTISEEELSTNKEKTNRHLRLRELLQEHSSEAELIVMTLPMPRRGHISAPLYLTWLDLMTDNLPPTLLVRGNQASVLTFYS